VLEKLGVFRVDMRKMIHDFIKSDPDLADHYQYQSLRMFFVVGIPNSPDEIAVNCEMYGHIASSEEDLIVHKRSRGLIFIL
jgi:hypothetical protein